MYKLIGYSEASSGIKEFVADTEADLVLIPDCEMGSQVVIIETGNVYIKDGNKAWRIM